MSGVIDTIRRAPHSGRVQRSQSGFTLLEALVSLALVSGVVLTLATGMLTTTKSSNSAKGTQIVDGALSAYAESFKGRYPPSGSGCPLALEFEDLNTQPAWFADGSDVTDFGVTRTQGWDEENQNWVDCASATPPSSDVVRLEVTVTADTPVGSQTATGQIVVRRV